MLADAQLGASLSQAPRLSYAGFAARIVPPTYYRTPLSCEGSGKKSGRYHVRGTVEVLYLADTLFTALYEIGGAIDVGERIFDVPITPRHLVSVVCRRLENLVDLTAPDLQALFGTSLQELTGAWAPYADRGPAPTQRFGLAAYHSGVAGMRVPSAARTSASNYVLFCERFNEDNLRVFEST